MLNAVILMGRMVVAPEMKQTTTGIATCTFRIAVERSFAKAGEARKADFIDIVAWRQTAEFVCKYFGKGSMIAVEGELQTRNYDDKNGVKRYVTEIIARQVHFTGEKRADAQSGALIPASAVGKAPAPDVICADSNFNDFTVIDDNQDLPF